LDFTESRGMRRENLMIVDFLNLCFRYKHANKKVFASEIIATIQSLGTSYGARDIVIAGDWGSAWRKDIYPEYKANRQAMRDKQTEEETQAFNEFLEEANRAYEMLTEMYMCFKFKGVEADDIAAYIAVNYNGSYEHTWLISSDKDWDLLIADNISRFSYVTRKEITMFNWETHYDYPVDWHISVKVLDGDTGDNVPGVAGVGPKRAISLIHEYGSAYDVFDSLPIDSHLKYIQNLNEFGDQILLNYDLMDLVSNCTAAIGSEGVTIINEEMA